MIENNILLIYFNPSSAINEKIILFHSPEEEA